VYHFNCTGILRITAYVTIWSALDIMARLMASMKLQRHSCILLTSVFFLWYNSQQEQTITFQNLLKINDWEFFIQIISVHRIVTQHIWCERQTWPTDRGIAQATNDWLSYIKIYSMFTYSFKRKRDWQKEKEGRKERKERRKERKKNEVQINNTSHINSNDFNKDGYTVAEGQTAHILSFYP
jgi:hypothetical protein